MISSILLSIAMTAGAPAADNPGPEPKDLAAYKSASAAAGRDPNAHVRLALWCEAHHLTAERLKHLALAVLYEPSNALARGLMGLVAYQGKWERPEQVSRAVENDEPRARRGSGSIWCAGPRPPIGPRTSGNWRCGASKTI